MDARTIKSKIQSFFFPKHNRGIEEREVSYAQIQKEMKKDKDAIVIDVRSPQEYQEGHLQYSINIPSYELESRMPREIANKQTTIFLYCQTGHRSVKATEVLKKIGYENVYTLKGGLDEK